MRTGVLLFRKFFRIALIAAVVLVVLPVAIRLTLPALAVKVINARLAKVLNAPVSLGRLDLALPRGRVEFGALRIDQPDAFGKGRLLSAGEVRVKLKPATLINPPLVIEEVALVDVEFNLVRNRMGVFNTEVAFAPPAPSPPVAHAPAEESAPSKPILIEKITVDSLDFSYTDSSLEKGPLRIKVADLNLTAARLVVGSASAGGEEPGQARLTARVVQGPLPDALLGACGRLGPIGEGVPTLNAAARLFGLELETVDAILPAGTAQAIGGDALDLSADLALSPGILDCSVRVKTVAGHAFSLPVGGTPGKPEVDTSGVLFNIMLRMEGGVGNLAGNLPGAGMGVAGTVVDTVSALGRGAVNTASSLGLGVFKTVKGVVAADLSGIAEGLQRTAIGMVSSAAGGVMDAGGKVVGGGVAAGTVLVGKDKAAQWRAAVRERWLKSWEEAQRTVDEAPFPPQRGRAGQAGLKTPETARR